MTMGLALLFTLSFGLTTSVAASPCQGLSQGECKSNDICVWVDGKKVKSYCRAKPGHGDDAGGKKKRKEKKSKKDKVEKSNQSDDSAADTKIDKKDKKKKKKDKKDKKKKDTKKKSKKD